MIKKRREKKKIFLLKFVENFVEIPRQFAMHSANERDNVTISSGQKYPATSLNRVDSLEKFLPRLPLIAMRFTSPAFVSKFLCTKNAFATVWYVAMVSILLVLPYYR